MLSTMSCLKSSLLLAVLVVITVPTLGAVPRETTKDDAPTPNVRRPHINWAMIEQTLSTNSANSRSFFNLLPVWKRPDLKTYDAVFDMEDISDLVYGAGWDLFVRDQETAKRFKDMDKDATSVVISAIGQYNRGKTFVINKIAKREFESGHAVHTKGISVILSKQTEPSENGTIVLDTAGEDQSCEPDKIVERRASESLIRSVVFDVSDITFVVVNELRLSDQMIIDQTISMATEKGRDPTFSVVVVHNLKTIETLEDAKFRIEKDVIHAFNATKQDFSMGKTDETFYWTSNIKTSEGKIDAVRHIVLCRDSTPAGYKYNEAGFRAIWGAINQYKQQRLKEGERDPIFTHILTAIDRNLPSYVRSPAGTKPILSATGDPSKGAVRVVLGPQDPNVRDFVVRKVHIDGIRLISSEGASTPGVSTYVPEDGDDTSPIVMLISIPGLELPTDLSKNCIEDPEGLRGIACRNKEDTFRLLVRLEEEKNNNGKVINEKGIELAGKFQTEPIVKEYYGGKKFATTPTKISLRKNEVQSGYYCDVSTGCFIQIPDRTYLESSAVFRGGMIVLKLVPKKESKGDFWSHFSEL